LYQLPALCTKLPSKQLCDLAGFKKINFNLK
jgi:hypothetical protein